jgi:hypothetical protein
MDMIEKAKEIIVGALILVVIAFILLFQAKCKKAIYDKTGIDFRSEEDVIYIGNSKDE